MAYKKMGSSLRLTLNGVKSTVDPCSKLKKWGHPLKGLSREKTPLPTKKNTSFFRLSSYFRTSTASLYCHLFSPPLFLLLKFHRFLRKFKDHTNYLFKKIISWHEN